MSQTRGTFLGAGLLLFVVGCGGGGGAASPDAAFKDFQAAVKAKDGEKAWNLLSKEGKSEIEQGVALVKGLMEGFFKQLDKAPPAEKKAAEEKMGMSLAEFKAMDAKGFFVFGIKHGDKGPNSGNEMKQFTDATLENLKVEGDKATATMKSGDKTKPISFVKEGGSWKITPPSK